MTAMITLTPITEPTKLEEYFRFRYRIYSESRQAGFLNGSSDGLDVDAFDARALHFGWYLNDVLEGCIRFVQPDGSATPLPMLTHITEPNARAAVLAYIDERWRMGQHMVGASRFCLAPEHRGLRTAKAFVLAMLKAMLPYGVQHGLFDCDVQHGRFYNALGFEPLTCCEHIPSSSMSNPKCVMHYDLRRMLTVNAELRESMGFIRGKVRQAA